MPPTRGEEKVWKFVYYESFVFGMVIAALLGYAFFVDASSSLLMLGCSGMIVEGIAFNVARYGLGVRWGKVA